MRHIIDSQCERLCDGSYDPPRSARPSLRPLALKVAANMTDAQLRKLHICPDCIREVPE